VHHVDVAADVAALVVFLRGEAQPQFIKKTDKLFLCFSGPLAAIISAKGSDPKHQNPQGTPR
jgi:hypothetical protein